MFYDGVHSSLHFILLNKQSLTRILRRLISEVIILTLSGNVLEKIERNKFRHFARFIHFTVQLAFVVTDVDGHFVDNWSEKCNPQQPEIDILCDFPGRRQPDPGVVLTEFEHMCPDLHVTSHRHANYIFTLVIIYFTRHDWVQTTPTVVWNQHSLMHHFKTGSSF